VLRAAATTAAAKEKGRRALKVLLTMMAADVVKVESG
jgi:hypothetical protein